MPSIVHHANSRLRVLLAIAALLLAFGIYLESLEPGFQMPSQPELEPAGRTAWTTVVARGAGTHIEAEELEKLAESMLIVIEDRLAEIARSTGQGSDWRAIYRAEQAEQPADTSALLEVYRREIELARTFVGELGIVPLPKEGIEVAEARNPVILDAFSMAFYMDGRLGIAIESSDDHEAEDLSNHCNICIPPLVVHETYPGHHVAFSSIGQKRLSGDPIDYYFHEGWALYAEILMIDKGYYETPERAIGAWRNVLLRTMRALIDPRLHRGAIDKEEATAIYRDRLMLSKRAAESEVRGHLLKPGIKPSYFIGLLQILEVRKKSLTFSEPISLLDFHRRLLREIGSWPDISEREFGIDIFDLETSELPAATWLGEQSQSTQTGS